MEFFCFNNTGCAVAPDRPVPERPYRTGSGTVHGTAEAHVLRGLDACGPDARAGVQRAAATVFWETLDYREPAEEPLKAWPIKAAARGGITLTAISQV
jgi:hypothetical protein